MKFNYELKINNREASLKMVAPSMSSVLESFSFNGLQQDVDSVKKKVDWTGSVSSIIDRLNQIHFCQIVSSSEEGDSPKPTYEEGDSPNSTYEEGDSLNSTSEEGYSSKLTSEEGDSPEPTYEEGDSPKPTYTASYSTSWGSYSKSWGSNSSKKKKRKDAEVTEEAEESED